MPLSANALVNWGVCKELHKLMQREIYSNSSRYAAH